MPDYSIFDYEVGAGQVAIAPIPGRGGHYAADWSALVRWQPDIVISMTEFHEMEKVGAAQLGPELEKVGIKWHHLPVGDYGVPSQSVTQEWSDVEKGCVAALANGARILIHCFGGCGRSGMIALKLMGAMGHPPKDALVALRKKRPCAVETDAQFDWASQA